MSPAPTCVDLDDAGALLDADREGLLRASATAGAQVRATGAAVEEGALESIAGGQRPRSVIWLAGRGPAATAGDVLIGILGATAAEPLVSAARVPPWIGPLDVLVVAGDDPGDPALVSAVDVAVRRGARVVVVAPFEGPLREAAAGRAAVLEPRLWTPEDFGLCRYLAAGLATMAAVDPAITADLPVLADELDAEALRNSAAREVFTNPAKALAERFSGRPVVLAGDCPATLALARHGAAVLLRVAGHTVAATGLADALVALRRGVAAGVTDPVEALFHDEQIDGPMPGRPMVVALTLAEERAVLTARTAGIDDVDLMGAEDVGAGSAQPVPGRAEQQLATLALRLEMAAVYLRLAGG